MKPDIKLCVKCKHMSEFGPDKELFCMASHKQQLDSNGHMRHSYSRILSETFEIPEVCPYKLEFLIK